MNFKTWFKTFLEEKNIDMSEPVTAGDGSQLFIGDVCTVIMNTDKNEQATIKAKLCQIDYINGDVPNFFRFIGKALNASHRTQFPTLVQFKVGKTYFCRSIANYDSVFQITVASRTEKSLRTTEGKLFRIGVYEGVEKISPMGRYSMSPTIYANKELT